MNRIEALIEQLCPDGVESQVLNDLCFKTSKIKWQEHVNTSFRYIDLSSVTRDSSNITTTQIINALNAPSRAQQIVLEGDVIFGTTRPTLQRFALITKEYHGQICSTGFCVLRSNKEFLVPKFLFYYLKTAPFANFVTANQEGANYPSISDKQVKKFIIPVPPLEIQNEIVNILDKFTSLEAELEAELKARKTQYEHYRDHLLSFEGKSVEWKTLDELGHFTRGKRFVKTDILSEGIPCIHYGEMYTHYKIWAKESKSFLNPELAAKLRVARTGDVIIVAAGETIEDIGQGVAWLGKDDVVIHDACFAYSHTMHPNYVAHFLQTGLFHSQIKKHISSGKISSINAAGLGKAKIPIPPFEKQKEIADVLDKFDALVNDISWGLPAEIEARRKQYEYYRNKLLTFKHRTNGQV